jgi:signal peptidase II
VKNVKGFLRAAIIILVIVMNISCDQVSKSIVRKNIDEHERIELFNNYLILMKVENTGAFLSAGNTLPPFLKLILLLVLPLIALGAGLYFILRKQQFSPLFLLGISCVIGGGIGNLFDRIAYGSVTDFLFIRAGMFHTGVFNMADVSITTGIGILLLYSFMNRKKADPAPQDGI